MRRQQSCAGQRRTLRSRRDCMLHQRRPIRARPAQKCRHERPSTSAWQGLVGRSQPNTLRRGVHQQKRVRKGIRMFPFVKPARKRGDVDTRLQQDIEGHIGHGQLGRQKALMLTAQEDSPTRGRCLQARESFPILVLGTDVVSELRRRIMPIAGSLREHKICPC